MHNKIFKWPRSVSFLLIKKEIWGCILLDNKNYYKKKTLIFVVLSWSHAQLFMTQWTVAHQAQWEPVHGDCPGKNTGVSFHFLLQGIFVTQGLNSSLLGLLHWQAGSLPLCHVDRPISWTSHINSNNLKKNFFYSMSLLVIYLNIAMCTCQSDGSVVNNPASAGDAKDADSVPGLRRSPGAGHSNPLQYSCLENPIDRGASWAVHGVTKFNVTEHAWTCQSQTLNLHYLQWFPPPSL